MKTILVSKERTNAKEVKSYLPRNYSLTQETNEHFIVEGEDVAGWTAETYVIPRLGSGMIQAQLKD